VEAFEIVLTMLCIGGFGVVLLRLRAVDRRTEKSREDILGAIGTLREEVGAVRASYASALAAVKIGEEIVELDEEMQARLDAVTDKSNERGGMNALYDALARGITIADRGFETDTKDPEREDETGGRVVPLRPRGKPTENR
jgi:hypothetical protein